MIGILENRVIQNVIHELPVSSSCTFPNRDLESEVNTIVVHQTDTACRGERQIEETAEYHVNHRGFCGIGYHVFITENGKIYQTLNLRSNGAHAGTHNGYSIGIVMCGDWRLENGVKNEDLAASKKQYKALVWTLAHLQNSYPQFKNIVSHDSVSSSRSDPNLHMEDLLADVKKKRLQILLVKWGFLALLFIFIISIGRKILYLS